MSFRRIPSRQETLIKSAQQADFDPSLWSEWELRAALRVAAKKGIESTIIKTLPHLQLNNLDRSLNYAIMALVRGYFPLVSLFISSFLPTKAKKIFFNMLSAAVFLQKKTAVEWLVREFSLILPPDFFQTRGTAYRIEKILGLAAARKNVEILQLVLEHGTGYPYFKVDFDHCFALREAAKNKCGACFEFLLKFPEIDPGCVTNQCLISLLSHGMEKQVDLILHRVNTSIRARDIIVAAVRSGIPRLLHLFDDVGVMSSDAFCHCPTPAMMTAICSVPNYWSFIQGLECGIRALWYMPPRVFQHMILVEKYQMPQGFFSRLVPNIIVRTTNINFLFQFPEISKEISKDDYLNLCKMLKYASLSVRNVLPSKSFEVAKPPKDPVFKTLFEHYQFDFLGELPNDPRFKLTSDVVFCRSFNPGFHVALLIETGIKEGSFQGFEDVWKVIAKTILSAQIYQWKQWGLGKKN